MRSKTSCFNGTLFRKNLSRYWPLWGLASFGGAMFPLAMLLELLHNGFRFWSPLETRQAYYTVLSYGVPVISIVYAILCAMAVWSYLYNARSVGMMHTLPIRREGLFVTNVLSGLTMMAIPYAVTGVLLVLVTMLFGGFEPMGVLVTVLGVMGESLFFFGLATFCAFIVGNVFMLPALYGLLNFIAVLTDFMVNLLAQGFCFGLNSSYSGTVEWLSPVVYLVQKISPNNTYETQWVTDRLGGQRYETSVLTSVTLENGWLIAAYAAAGAALLGLAWLLYRRRRSESAGDVVAVGWMKPVFRYGCAVYAAILGGRLLYALLWDSFQSGRYFTVLPMILCMIAGGAVGYYAASMLLAKTPRVFKTTWKGMLAVALGCAALCGAMKCDLFGVVRRVPAPDSVKLVNVYAAGSNYYLTPGKDDALIEKVRTLHQTIIDDKDYIMSTAEGRSVYMETEEGSYTIGAPASEIVSTSVSSFANTSVRFTYTLNSGLKVERRYNLYLTQNRMDQEDTYDHLLDQLINSQEMRQKRIRWRDEGFQLDGAWIDTWRDYSDLSSREVGLILDAVAKDAENGDWGVYNWFQADNDADSYEIQIHFQYKLPESQFDRTYDAIQVNVKEGMTETIRALKDLKLITDADLVTNRERYPWQYAAGGWDQYDQFYGQFHMSPEEYYERYSEYPAGWFGTESDDSSTETEIAPAVDDSHSPSMSDGAEATSFGIIGGADGPTVMVTIAA
jgi:ABC-2 type transport system permease protein